MLIAGKVPPPGKLKGYKPPGGEPNGDVPEGENDDDAAEDEAAGTSMMQEFFDDAGIKGDAAAACKSLDAYLEARGFVKK